MAKNLASLTLMLGANIKGFQTSMRKASADLKRVGKQMQGMGKSMSMYVTAPIVAMGAASVIAFDKQAQAEAKLTAQVAMNGKAVQATMADYKSFASQLQGVTIVGDEVTLGMMQMAESMESPNVKEATQGAIGLSKALGVDLTAALKMTVLAQAGEYTMLNRYVPALRTATTETEKAAIVAKLYASGLEIAKAEAQTGLGPIKQLQNSVGDLMESFGEIISEALKPAVQWLKEIVEKFQALTPQTKKTIVLVAAIAAAMGPLLIALGSLAMLLPVIASGFAAIFSPVTLVIGAIAAIAAAFVYVYGNWQAFKERLGDWNWLKNAAIDSLIAIIKASSFFFNEIAKLFGVDFVAPIEDALNSLKSPITESKTEFKGFGETIKEVMGKVMQSLGLFADNGTADLKAVEDQANATGKAIKTMGQSLKLDAPTSIGNKTASKINAPIKVKPEKSPYFEQQIADLKEHGIKLNKTIANLSISKGTEAFKKRYSEKMEELTQAMNSIASAAFADFGIKIGEAIGDLLSGEKIDFGKTVLESIGHFLKEMGSALIIYAGIVKAFESTFTNPYAAIAFGIAAVAAGTILINTANKGPEQMAMGGIVPAGFPNDSYPALLTSGERVIPAAIPLPAMDGGGGNLHFTGSSRISGKDLLIIFDKAMADRNRTRGY